MDRTSILMAWHLLVRAAAGALPPTVDIMEARMISSAVCYRLYITGEKLAEGAVMAADPSLPLERISKALHALFDTLSDPDTLPEFRALQVICLA